MKQIFIPTTSPESWKMFLAEPDKHWKTGYSAKALAYCWENADGFPDEIEELFEQSSYAPFRKLEMLLAIPEYEVPLPGGRQGSQNDVFALAKDAEGQLVSIMVEGKVSEVFGPTLAEWTPGSSEGKIRRLEYLQTQLELTGELPEQIRYQLLHRTASAVITAQRFNARSAVMIVHSFSQTDEWFGDYQQFVALFGVERSTKALTPLREINGISLYSGWATGSASYLEV